MKCVFLFLFVVVPCSALAQSSWTETWLLNGDLRVRSEQVIDATNASPQKTHERNRHRLRARLSVTGKVNSKTHAVFRLATGDQTASGATSTNQDETNFGAKKMFNLDLAYVNWRPSEPSQLWIGKAPVVFFQPGGSDMLFDSDMTLEGMFFKDQFNSDSFKSFVNLGYSILNERHDGVTPQNQPDVILVGGDFGVETEFENYSFSVGAGYLNFANIQDTSAGTTTLSIAKGNTTETSGTTLTFRNKYEVTRIFAEFRALGAGSKIVFYFDYAKNLSLPEGNIAQLYGMRWGDLKEVGQWWISLDFRDLQKDSTLGLITDGDSAGGGTDLRSFKFSVQHQLDQGISVGLSHYDGVRNVSTAGINYKKTFIDLNANF